MGPVTGWRHEIKLLGSVRARTALGATAVVAVALIIAGLLVIAVLRASLGDTASSRAEAKAREVATQVASVARPTEADGLDTDDPVQVVDGNGRVLAKSDGIGSMAPMSAVNRADPAQQSQSDDEPDDDADDADEVDEADEADERPRGEVSSVVEHEQVTLAVDDQGLPTSNQKNQNNQNNQNNAVGTAEFTVAAVRAGTPTGVPVTVYVGTSLETQQQVVDNATRSMLVGLPLVLGVVGVVTWLVTRRALRPVESIRAELSAITASDDLRRRVPSPPGRDEVAALARTTNETLSALEQSRERQRQFVADASHELRSPIASLRTQLEVGAAHPDLLDVDGAVQDVVRLQQLAADLLLLARLDAGESVQQDEVSLVDLVRDELAQRSDPINVELSVSGDPTVRGSRPQLSRVLTNLLDNAVRHARTTVHVSVSSCLITVTDDGPGVPDDQRERIFERFVRLDEARARDDGGAGLGLPIARDMLRRHGGDLNVRSAPGGGAVFEARFR